MKNNSIILLLAFLFTNIASGELRYNDARFDTLMYYSKKSRICEREYQRCLKLVQLCVDSGYTENAVVKQGLLQKEQYTLTILFKDICLKRLNRNSVRDFTNYVIIKYDSPEEGISHSYCDLFLINPELILSEIERRNKKERQCLVESISYGLLCFASEDSIKISDKTSIDECRKILFRVYPKIRKAADKHRTLVDVIIGKARESL